MKFTYYQDVSYYYFRKPAGIPSSFGKENSFLDYFSASNENQEVSNIFASLSSFFSREEEFGLLNRLDNDTAGLLYFAKNPRAKKAFKYLQSEHKLQKYYLADVYGNIRYYIEKNGSNIALPIGHHRFNTDRMVAVRSPDDKAKIKGSLHHEQTRILEYSFNEVENTSTLLICIEKGVRHQIRSHLSAIGYPLLGDVLYTKSKKGDLIFGLHLRSVGISKK